MQGRGGGKETLQGFTSLLYPLYIVRLILNALLVPVPKPLKSPALTVQHSCAGKKRFFSDSVKMAGL